MNTRKYNSTLREEQARNTRQRILEGASRIVMFRFERLTHRSVAKAAGVSERTVYRHFPTVDELHEAFREHQEKRFGGVYDEDISLDDLPAMFEQWPERLDEAAIDDYLRDQETPPSLVASRRVRYAIVQRSLAKEFPDATPDELRQVVIVLTSLMSPDAFARGKQILDLDISAVAVGNAWALRVLIDSLHSGNTPWK